VLDLSNEGPAFYRPIFDDLHVQLVERGIEPSALIFVSQNRRLGEDYARTYGRGMRFWNYDHFPNAIALWMDAQHGPRAFGAQAFDPGSYAPLADSHGPIFLCQSAAMRWHRILLYRWLQRSGLDRDGLISFHGIGADNPKGSEINIEAPPEIVMANFGELVADIAEWIPRKAERFDRRTAFGNELVMSIETAAYARTRFSIVPESDFFFGGVERITEKSLKAAAMGHPLVVLGAPRTLAFLRELGFCTFDGAIDQSYDRLEDPVERMRAAFDAIIRTHHRAKTNPAAWRRATLDEALLNFAHARGGGLFTRLNMLVSRPLVSRMERFVLDGEID
jgi:hypothetical protein